MESDVLMVYLLGGASILLLISTSTVAWVAIARARRDGRVPQPVEVRIPMAIIMTVFARFVAGVAVVVGGVPWPAWPILTIVAVGADYIERTPRATLSHRA